MADEQKRTFTEGETYALVADAVERETAAVAADLDAAKRETAELQTKIDVLETEKAAADQRATAAEEALEAFKAEIADREAAAERLATRTEAFAKVSSLELTDERSARIVAMDDEAFEAYLTDLREAAAEKPADTKEKASESMPRQSAAFSGTPSAPAGDTPKTSPVAAMWGARAAVQNA